MQESTQLREERKLEQRGWLGCMLVFALAAIIMALVTALPDVFIQREPPQPPWSILVSALLALVLTLVVGIAGLVLMLRLIFWSGEAERRRRQRGTAVFRQTLPGLPLEPETPISARKFSGWQLTKIILLFLVYVVGVILVASAAGNVIRRVLPGVPDLVTPIIAIGLSLLALYLVGKATGRARGNPIAEAPPPAKPHVQEQPKPGRSRAAGLVLYCILAFVPLIGVLSLLVRIPVSPLLIPILALGVCGVVLLVITAIYIISPLLWIARAVKRCQYDDAIARARFIENLSIFPGFYLNLHGAILLWAGQYEEARKTFEESIGEQRKEVMGGGSAALENIGCALAWQGQYEEAIKMFEGSIAISQEQAMVYSDLAEALLHQDAELPRALELTERAWKNHQASFESRRLSSHQGGQILANRAWALAKLGRFREADETLTHALAVADKGFKPVLAGIHLRAGYVMLARGERQKADEYFRKGQQLDPRGHYGRLCAEELKHVD